MITVRDRGGSDLSGLLRAWTGRPKIGLERCEVPGRHVGDGPLGYITTERPGDADVPAAEWDARH